MRRGISAQLARVHGVRLDRDLAALASGAETIVAGPWLGEVGFELDSALSQIRTNTALKFTGDFSRKPAGKVQ